jgi:hypothetical protein
VRVSLTQTVDIKSRRRGIGGSFVLANFALELVDCCRLNKSGALKETFVMLVFHPPSPFTIAKFEHPKDVQMFL